MSFDFAASQKRLEARGKAFAEQIRRKAEVERIQKERAAARAAALEDAQRERRLEQAAAEQAERDHLAADLEQNRGVTWRAELLAYPLPAGTAEARGLRRAADKLILPRSAGAALMDQGAPKNGAMFFEITCLSSGAHTHAGLLEFSGDEGRVGMPEAVAAALWGPEGSSLDAANPKRVMLRYRTLQRGERVVLQPAATAFHAAVGPGVKEALEAALGGRATLTEGDWVAVGDQWLRVRELWPDPQVSILDTDLEADISASLETEERIREEEMAARARLEALAAEALENAKAQEAAAAAVAAATAAAQQMLDARVKAAAQLAERLPLEPPGGAPGTTTCMLRLGDGTRLARRFLLSDPLQSLFDFAEAQGATTLPEKYSLALQYPRRRLTLENAAVVGSTLADAGLTGPQDTLFVEADGS